jgi:transposase-like protein
MDSTSNAQAWADRLDRYEPLATTVAQFCRAESVSPASYYYWRRKIRENQLGSADRPTKSLARFIPVALSASATPKPPSVMAVDLPGGIRIRFEIPAHAEARNDEASQS